MVMKRVAVVVVVVDGEDNGLVALVLVVAATVLEEVGGGRRDGGQCSSLDTELPNLEDRDDDEWGSIVVLILKAPMLIRSGDESKRRWCC